MTLCHCGAEAGPAFFCRNCIDRCHEATEYDHSCPVCRAASDRDGDHDESEREWEAEGMATALSGINERERDE